MVNNCISFLFWPCRYNYSDYQKDNISKTSNLFTNSSKLTPPDNLQKDNLQEYNLEVGLRSGLQKHGYDTDADINDMNIIVKRYISLIISDFNEKNSSFGYITDNFYFLLEEGILELIEIDYRFFSEFDKNIVKKAINIFVDGLSLDGERKEL
jgi:hypothetical protein